MLSKSDAEFVQEMILKYDGPEFYRLYSIIDKQSRALEKCKKQRDAGINSLHSTRASTTIKRMKDDLNKELSEILGDANGEG